MISSLSLKLGEIQTIANDETRGIRALVLKSNGKNFSAGADLEYMKELGKFSKDQNYADAMKLSDMFNKLCNLTVPTLAIVQGSAFGGALGLISCCDIALCEAKSKFCFSEVKLGLIPATISPFVIKKIGSDQAKRLFLTGEVFDASLAKDLGLIHCIAHTTDNSDTCPDELRLALHKLEEKYINYFLINGPTALRRAKELVNEVVQLEKKGDMRKVREMSAMMLAEVRESDEAKEGLASFLEKRKALYNVAQ